VSKPALEKLEALEARVRGLVEMVQELKRSNAALQTELRSARERLITQEEQGRRWEEERGDIKSRIERVLDELDLLEGLEETNVDYSEAASHGN
jgi:chromosome segregation ATPase